MLELKCEAEPSAGSCLSWSVVHVSVLEGGMLARSLCLGSGFANNRGIHFLGVQNL